jgi:adenylate kinase
MSCTGMCVLGGAARPRAAPREQPTLKNKAYTLNQVALQDQELLRASNGRLAIECAPPELNPEMDTFRSGTMLELVREMAIRVAVVCNKRVKVCIQGSLGEGIFTGLPLMLSGMRRTLEAMDWQSAPGETYEGILVNDILDRRTGKVAKPGNPEGLIAFGAVGAEHMDPADEVLLIIAPQSMVGASVYEPLSEMVMAAAGRPVVLLNARLQDRPSSGSLMRVGGRAERISFAESFVPIYHFRLLFKGSQFMFPIRGALRYNLANSRSWTVFLRQDDKESLGAAPEELETESYTPLGNFPEEPDAAVITRLIEDHVRKLKAAPAQ